MATSKQYVIPETSKSFKASGGDVTLTFTSLANGAGRYSGQLDRGSGAKAANFRVECTVKAAAGLAVGATFEVWLATAQSSSSVIDGNLGTTDATLATDKRKNLKLIGVIVADSTSSGELQVGSWNTYIDAQYVTIGVWNALGQALTGTASDHFLTLIPMPPEMQ